jgi:hypothetical protein
MSNKRITDLTELTNPTTDDVFPVVDIATNTTTKVQLGNLPVPSSVTTALTTKQDSLVSGTNIKTINSTSVLGSGNIAVQETLVSGTNIKTLNNTSLLGSGNIVLTANPSGVSGAIQFSNSSAFASDAANFFWDDTNKRLGIGTNVPTVQFEVIGNSRLRGNLNINGIINNSSTGIVDLNSLVYVNGVTNGLGVGISATTARLQVRGTGSTSATTSLLVQNSAGTAALTVKDDLSATFGGSITTSNSVIANNLAIGTQGVYFQAANNTSMVPSNLGWNLQYTGATNNVQIGRTGFIGSRQSSASLQVDATTQGFLPPRMTTTERNAIASPAAGLMIYNTTTAKLNVYTTAWEAITSL